LEEGLFEVVAVGGELGNRSLREQVAMVDDHHGVNGLRDLGEHVVGADPAPRRVGESDQVEDVLDP
jgi:hypothetical protein